MIPMFSYAQWESETIVYKNAYINSSDDQTALVIQKVNDAIQVYIQTNRYVGGPDVQTNWIFDPTDANELGNTIQCDFYKRSGLVVVPSDHNSYVIESLMTSKKLYIEVFTNNNIVYKFSFEPKGAKEVLGKMLDLE